MAKGTEKQNIDLGTTNNDKKTSININDQTTKANNKDEETATLFEKIAICFGIGSAISITLALVTASATLGVMAVFAMFMASMCTCVDVAFSPNGGAYNSYAYPDDCYYAFGSMSAHR
ncbi:MAG: hypothetical protein COB50_03510 [Thiotrichales bacterium]|nr:MAG: hypothetical protein COB50_03510 [Thiotrichales bacterium]